MPTEREFNAEEKSKIHGCVEQGFECVGLLVEFPKDPDDPLQVVTAIRLAIDEMRKGRRAGRDYLDLELVADSLGILWGEQVRRALGWEWIFLRFDEDLDLESYGIASPDRSTIVLVAHYIYRLLTQPDADNSVLFTFNMLLANTRPLSTPGSYMRLN
jgi:hypothetical protein